MHVRIVSSTSAVDAATTTAPRRPGRTTSASGAAYSAQPCRRRNSPRYRPTPVESPPASDRAAARGRRARANARRSGRARSTTSTIACVAPTGESSEPGVVSKAGAEALSCATSTARDRNVLVERAVQMARDEHVDCRAERRPRRSSSRSPRRGSNGRERLIDRARTRRRAPSRSAAARRACAAGSRRTGRRRCACAAPRQISRDRLLARYDPARVAQEQLEQVGLARAQRDRRPPRCERRASRRRARGRRTRALLGRAAAAQQRTNAREQLLRANGFTR